MPGVNSWDGPLGKFYKIALGVVAVFIALVVVAVAMSSGEDTSEIAAAPAETESDLPVSAESGSWESEHSAEALSALQAARSSLETIARSYTDLFAAADAGDAEKADIALSAIALELTYLDGEAGDRLAKVVPPTDPNARSTWVEAVSAVAALSEYKLAFILMPAEAERLLTEPTDEELAILEGLSAAVDRAYLAMGAARSTIDG